MLRTLQKYVYNTYIAHVANTIPTLRQVYHAHIICELPMHLCHILGMPRAPYFDTCTVVDCVCVCVCVLTSGMGILLGVALLLVAQSCVASCAAVLGPGR